ncbi:MAG: MotA/TolQ/ExbB proton channel family protein [Deltaproteobacteria bacterium]|nr:MAG: MotA/TolQ/ExbB proton channel family protein [Deltaproteobacteria bacterium]
MIDYFFQGGVVMYPILFLSILALAIILERSFYLYRLARTPRVDLATIVRAVNAGECDSALSLVSGNRNPVAVVLTALILNLSEGKKRAELIEIASAVGSQAVGNIEGRIKILPLVVQLAPLLGLLGTVTGMIQAFQVIEHIGGKVNAMALAGGIWEAMLTTAFGLFVAIPTAFCHFMLEKRVDGLAEEVNVAASRVLSTVDSNQGS